ncbi:2-hydroxyacid dehydrogenase [Halalkalibaculum sp. DA384]|uniref:2-hydroxyacid dehydrogenase n=1 Tax=Halalkalibaculum sp. DA384 TaxID=3373606 RepID=UPI0037542AB6
MSYRILITEPIVDSVIEKLEEHYEVVVGTRGQYSDEETLVQAIPEFDALLPMLSCPVTERVLRAGSRLKIVANHAVGYNNIDVEAARQKGVKVANTPGVLSESSADCAMALMLAVARKIVDAQQFLYDGKFDGWDPLAFLGMELNDKTLGIFGMGRIGTAVARRARAFGMHITYHNRSRVDEETEQKLEAEFIPELDTLVEQADVLSLNCPLTDETHHAIDAGILERMPDHALLINTARGPVVDEAALAEALHNGTIGGAGLDVFEEEPEVHPDLLSAPNCVLTPHIASATHETRKAIGMLAANAIIGVLEGTPDEEIPNLIQG